MHEIDREAGVRRGKSQIHPAARLIVTIFFLIITVSYSKYDLAGVLGMAVFLLITGIWEDLSFRRGFARLKYAFALLFFIGVVNPFFDREIQTYFLGIGISGGVISMLTLFLKGAFCVMATYFLMTLCGMDGICGGLRILHVPKGAVTVLLLIYRYLIVLLKEVQRMQQAYKLRAPKQKGVEIRAWGSFAGLLLLRSIDRAKDVYESMLLRGFTGNYPDVRDAMFDRNKSILYALLWSSLFLVLRFVPVFYLVGVIF